MNERDRILALVREGIITTEEALVLLENLAKREGKDAVKFNQQQDFTDTSDTAPEYTEQTDQDQASDQEREDRKNLEKILDELASEISYFSSQIDAKGEALQSLKKQINALIGLKNNYSSNLQIFLSTRNGRQDNAPKIPITRNSRAAPEPFPAPKSATQRLSVG